MSIPFLQDLPRSPINYSSEYKKYLELILKESVLTTLGAYSFPATSSGITYTGTGGEAGLLSALEAIPEVQNALLNALKWNSIQATINDVTLDLKTDMLETRALIEKYVNANIFANKTGYGGYTLFDSLSDDAINFGTTTATINTTSKNCTWDSTGTKLLAFNPVTFNNTFTSMACKIDGDYRYGTVQTGVTNSNSISVMSNNYTLTTADKLYAYSVASAKKKEVGITNVTGGSIIYDRTTPVTVINQNYITSSNARPKFMSNGWIINAVYTTNTVKIYVSLDNGATFIDTTINIGVASTSPIFAIDVLGTSIYIAQINTTNDVLNFRVYTKNLDTGTSWTTGTSSAVISSQTSFDSVAIKMLDANTGAIVATSKNATYPNSFNVVFAKTTNGGTAWTKQNGTTGFDQLTTTNTSGIDNTDVDIIYTSASVPYVVYALNQSTTTNNISAQYWNGSTWSSVTIFSNNGYNQRKPTLLLKKYGSNLNRIVIKWEGRDATDTTFYNQRIAYTDNLSTFTVVGKMTTGNTVNRIGGNMSEDSNGNLYAIYDDNGTVKYQISTNDSTTWGSLTTIATGTTPTTCDNYAQFENPITLFDGGSDIKFYGKWSTGGSYNLTLSENVTQSINDQLPITTQYTIQQGVTPFLFDSVVNNASLQYKLNGLSTPTVNLSILGKSTISTAVAYAVG